MTKNTSFRRAPEQTRALVCAVVATGAIVGMALAGEAQSPGSATPPTAPAGQATAPAGRGAAPAGRGTAPVNHEIPNERSNVPIDQFIGHPLHAPGHLSHGGLLTRSMLRHGNPNVPGPPGAVLEYRTQIATATLTPKSSTALMSIDSQFLFYVAAGEGRLDNGQEFWDLREGISILIPPGVPRRFTNASDAPLEMVMVEWPANALARKDILVRDANLLPYCEENAHWNNMSKCVFAQTDGMTGRVLLVMLLPMTMAAPHPHRAGTEEIWTKLTPGPALALLGSELREMPQFGAFLAPPNGITWHAQVNTSKTQIERWLYVAGGDAGGAVPAGAGAGVVQNQAPTTGGGRGATNPNLLFRDPAAVDRATVRGRPLQ